MSRGRSCRKRWKTVTQRTLSILFAFSALTGQAAAQTAPPLPALVPRVPGTAATPAKPAAVEAPFVQVHIPADMRAGFVTTAPAGDGTYYVTISDAAATNPSSTNFGWYSPSDFHLLADGNIYYPVVRPKLGAIGLSWTGSVPPLGTVVATVTFKVPKSVKVGDFEFIPKNWFNSWGGTQVFCCLYQL
jgi:hypothetical protein